MSNILVISLSFVPVKFEKHTFYIFVWVTEKKLTRIIPRDVTLAEIYFR